MYVRCHGCFRLFMPAWPNQLACKRACRQRAWLRRHFGPAPQAPECCIECGERLIDTEHPTRRFCDGRCRTRAYRARLASRRTMPMSSIITHVILPGLGPVCPECFSRGHVGALPVAPGEVYSFGITEPQAQLDWDVDAARALIAARPRTAQRLDANWLESWLAERTSITPEHLDHIPAGKLDEPGILIEIMAGPPGRRARAIPHLDRRHPSRAPASYATGRTTGPSYSPRKSSVPSAPTDSKVGLPSFRRSPARASLIGRLESF